MSTPSKTLAFFGATGGCAGSCLALSLKSNHKCTALARNPSKLTSFMVSKGVPQTAIDSNLTIISGNVRTLEDVKRTLAPGEGKEVVDVIVSGIGGTPALQWSLWKPVVLTDKAICQDAGGMVLQAARELTSSGASKEPLFINISTTGMYHGTVESPRDIPFLYIWFYRWVLQDPHADKEVLEARLKTEMEDSKKAGIRGYVNVKPSLLMDGPSLGMEKIRFGFTRNPAIGYSMRREDVGLFMFEKFVKQEVEGEWVNESVSLTY